MPLNVGVGHEAMIEGSWALGTTVQLKEQPPSPTYMGLNIENRFKGRLEYKSRKKGLRNNIGNHTGFHFTAAPEPEPRPLQASA